MYTYKNGNLYQGDMAIGDREATAEEVAAWIAARMPTAAQIALNQIRELESSKADAMAKLVRQSLLALALDRACADPLAVGLTREQVHAVLMSSNNGYKGAYELEQSVAALRAQL